MQILTGNEFTRPLLENQCPHCLVVKTTFAHICGDEVYCNTEANVRKMPFQLPNFSKPLIVIGFFTFALIALVLADNFGR